MLRCGELERSSVASLTTHKVFVCCLFVECRYIGCTRVVTGGVNVLVELMVGGCFPPELCDG